MCKCLIFLNDLLRRTTYAAIGTSAVIDPVENIPALIIVIAPVFVARTRFI